MYPMHPNEVSRLKALHDLEVFGSPSEPQYDAICRTAQVLFGVPIALVSLIGEIEQRFKSKCGLDMSGTPREDSFCTYTILSDEVMVVEDATQDERFAASPLVTGEPHIRFYAGAPLVLAPGIHLGSLCIIDRVPRTLSSQQQGQLRDLAQIVVAQLRLRRAERDARESAANYRLLADNSTDLIIRSDLDGTRRYVSPAARRILGHEPQELIGTHPLAFVHPDEADAYARLLKRLGAGQITQAVTQQRYRHRDGTWLWVEVSFSLTHDEITGEPNGYVAVLRDISLRKEAEREMARLARHDPLTGLPNRLLFREKLSQEFARAKRNGGGFALFCIDLDRFKLVNDTMGHQAGDTLLRVVAQRLKSVLCTEDTIARLGGDEFVIIQTGQGRADEAVRLAERLLEAVSPPADLGGYSAVIGISVGIALSPGDGIDPEYLYVCADQALYWAKAAGRNTFRLYTEDGAGTGPMPRAAGQREVTQTLGLTDPDPLFASDLLRDILESSTDCVKLLDGEGNLRFLSAGGSKVMEIDDVGPFLGRSWVDLWQGEHHTAARQAFAQARAGQAARFRGFCHTAKGHPKWWDVSLSPLQGHNGSRGRILAISRDVTAQVELERDLQTTANRYRALVEASATMVWRAKPDGSVIESSGWEAYSGQPESVYKGWGWLRAIHRDDRKRVISTCRAIIASQSAGTCEFRVLRRDAVFRWTLISVAPLKDSFGHVREWVGTATDIHERKHAAEAIRAQEERYRLALLATKDAIWDWDLTSDRIDWNEATQFLFGYAEDEIAAPGAWWKQRIHWADRERIVTSIQNVIQGRGNRWSAEYRFEQGDGNYADVLDRGFVIRDEQGRAVRMVGAMHDVTEQRLANTALKASEERLRLALRAARMVAWEHNFKTAQSNLSENSPQLLGIGSGSASQFYERVHSDDRLRMDRFIRGVGSRDCQEFRYFPPAGPMMWLSAAVERVDADRLVGITFDITERKLAEEQAWRAANQDALTGLPNRRLFQQRLEEALVAAERDCTSVNLLLIDVDTLRDVNDTLGHDAGDALLCEVASRLSYGLRTSDLVARLGGDEFAIILVEPLQLSNVINYAQMLIERLRQPFRYRSHTLTCKSSIGIAAFPDHHREPRELLKDADIALYRAKVLGRNRAVVFTAEMRAETEQRVSIAVEVRVALDASQIVPYYQPKVCFATGCIVGFEALARWQHPDKGLLTPGYFGSAFENPELAAAIGDAILRQVVADMGRWRNRGLNFGRVAVNFASAEFRKPDLAGDILNVLTANDVPPALLEMEVTETVFLGNGSGSVPGVLQRLHDRGVLISLDDFGTGFASLTHLKQFPVDHIKVDQSFVRDLEQDEGDAAIVAAVVGLGRSLGMHITAEGVETEGQAKKLRAMGCDYAQGYLYAKPMAGSRIPWLITTWDSSARRPEQSILRTV